MTPQPIVLSVFTVALGACTSSSSRFDQCVEERQRQFKQKNPDAPYSLLVNRREAFERECSHLK